MQGFGTVPRARGELAPASGCELVRKRVVGPPARSRGTPPHLWAQDLGFCGSTLPRGGSPDGHEENTNPSNAIWNCRPATQLGVVFGAREPVGEPANESSRRRDPGSAFDGRHEQERRIQCNDPPRSSRIIHTIPAEKRWWSVEEIWRKRLSGAKVNKRFEGQMTCLPSVLLTDAKPPHRSVLGFSSTLSIGRINDQNMMQIINNNALSLSLFSSIDRLQLRTPTTKQARKR
jgi:hypothetical protein